MRIIIKGGILLLIGWGIQSVLSIYSTSGQVYEMISHPIVNSPDAIRLDNEKVCRLSGTKSTVIFRDMED